MRLNDSQLKTLTAPANGAKVYHDETPGLVGFGLRVTAKGARAFVLTYGANRERITIGRYPLIGLAEARAEARRILAERTLGKHRPKRMTFQQAVDAFLEERKTRNRPKTHLETGKLLRGYFSHLAAMPLEDVAAHHITDVTDKLSKRGLQSTASHAHTAVKTMMRWCSRRQYISMSPVADLEKPVLPKPRERVLSDPELVAVYRAAEQMPSVFGRIIQLAILTGARRSEIQHIRLEDAAAVIDAANAKNHRVHRFPLTESARGILEVNPDLSWGGWSKGKLQLDKTSGITGWTIHDLRRTYATNLQRLGIKLEVIEALLNHVSGTRAGIVGVYQRHHWWDEMREAVDRYEGWLKNVVNRE